LVEELNVYSIYLIQYIFSRSLKVLSGQNSEQARPKTKQEGKKEKFRAVTVPVFI